MGTDYFPETVPLPFISGSTTVFISHEYIFLENYKQKITKITYVLSTEHHLLLKIGELLSDFQVGDEIILKKWIFHALSNRTHTISGSTHVRSSHEHKKIKIFKNKRNKMHTEI